MMRRRFYGEAPLEAFPLVAPVHEDGTYLTPDEIAVKLGSVNIIDKFNQSNIPNKFFAYSIDNSLQVISIIEKKHVTYYYYETVDGNERYNIYTGTIDITPTAGSTNRYVIASSSTKNIEVNNIPSANWIFTGYAPSVNVFDNKNIRHIHHNRVNSICYNSASNIEGVCVINKGFKIIYNCFVGCTKIQYSVFNGTLKDWCEGVTIGNQYANPMYLKKDFYIDGNIVDNIVLTEDIDMVGPYCFAYSPATSVSFLNDNVTLGSFSFFSSSISGELVLPKKITSVNCYVFDGCSKVTSLIIPNSLTESNNASFLAMSALTDVYYEGTLTDWCNITFNNANGNPLYNSCYLHTTEGKITDLIVPQEVSVLGKYQFNGIIADSLTLHNGITEIGTNCFTTSFKSLNLQTNVYYDFSTRQQYLTSISATGSDKYYINNDLLYYRDDEAGIYDLMCSIRKTYNDVTLDNCKRILAAVFNGNQGKYISGYLNIPNSVIEILASAPFYAARMSDCYFNWVDDDILTYQDGWWYTQTVTIAAQNVTVHVPQGQITNYKAKGYTTILDDPENGIFKDIIDDIILE